MVTLKAKKRTAQGKGAAKRLRRAGRIPAVIYGHSGESIPIDLDAAEFTNNARSITESTLVTVDIEGEDRDAFVKDTQQDILTGRIGHVDFFEIVRGQMLRARVPIRVTGNAIGVRDGGVLSVPAYDVEVECLPKNLPAFIPVDVTNLGTNESIHVRDLKLKDGVKMLTSDDEVVALVKFAKEEVEAAPAAAEAAEGAEAAAGAAPAEGAAAAAPAADGKAAPAAADGKAAAAKGGK
jgi:large subunit ribosomal protein L25